MEKPIFENCHYLSVGECPFKSTIERVLLVPQLFDPSRIADAKRLCEKCWQILVETRKAARVQRPLRVIITRRDQGESFHGTILDVSSGGALVKLENSPNFHIDEILCLKIYSYDSVSYKSDDDATSFDGTVKRLAENKDEIAVAFITEESNLEKSYQYLEE